MLRIDFGGHGQNREASQEATAVTQANQLAWPTAVDVQVVKSGQIIFLFQRSRGFAGGLDVGMKGKVSVID